MTHFLFKLSQSLKKGSAPGNFRRQQNCRTGELPKEKPVVTGQATATSFQLELKETKPVSQHSQPANAQAHCLILSQHPAQRPS